MFIDKINIKALKRQNNFDFYRKHVVKHIKILVYTCKLYYLCINKTNKKLTLKTSKVMKAIKLTNSADFCNSINFLKSIKSNFILICNDIPCIIVSKSTYNTLKQFVNSNF